MSFISDNKEANRILFRDILKDIRREGGYLPIDDVVKIFKDTWHSSDYIALGEKLVAEKDLKVVKFDLD